MVLCFLPAYSPNVHLIERVWRFVKKQCPCSKYYPDSISFQQATLTCIQQAPTKHKEELNQLLTSSFQTFENVSVIGVQQTASPKSKRKVLSKVASSISILDIILISFRIPNPG